jgi:hypothetical protein
MNMCGFAPLVLLGKEGTHDEAITNICASSVSNVPLIRLQPWSDGLSMVLAFLEVMTYGPFQLDPTLPASHRLKRLRCCIAPPLCIYFEVVSSQSPKRSWPPTEECPLSIPWSSRDCPK